jgi:hypothetical protein
LLENLCGKLYAPMTLPFCTPTKQASHVWYQHLLPAWSVAEAIGPQGLWPLGAWVAKQREIIL